MRVIIAQAGIDPTFSLGFGASGTAANLASAASVSGTDSTDLVLMERQGALVTIPRGNLLTLAGLAALLATAPTTLPGTSGVLWLSSTGFKLS